MNRLELAYLGLTVREPAALDESLGTIAGLLRTDTPVDGTIAWRNDDRCHRLLVTQGPIDDAAFIGFEVDSSASLDELVQRLERTGNTVTWDDGHRADLRRVNRLASVQAPWGVEVELVEGLASAPTPFDSERVPGGFLTHEMGFGHVVFAATAFEESCAFVMDGLGLRRSDQLQMELAPGLELEVWFFHGNARHHSLALARAPFEMPQKLHHFMLETNERDSVGLAFDRAWSTSVPIPNGLGRHDNDRMFSFYFQTPAGFMIEIGHGARVVDADWDDDRIYSRISAWGHQPLRGS